jgi:8-oxo-dGTP diphosphatase
VQLGLTAGIIVHELAGSTAMDINFHGVKIALLLGRDVLTYLRDDKPTIPWPAHWDLPGGGREANETPTECITREIAEEFEFKLDPAQIVYTRVLPASSADHPASIFMVGHVTSAQIAAIRFGSEGQRWQMMPVEDFLSHPQAVESLKDRLAQYLNNNSATR